MSPTGTVASATLIASDDFDALYKLDRVLASVRFYWAGIEGALSPRRRPRLPIELVVFAQRFDQYASVNAQWLRQARPQILFRTVQVRGHSKRRIPRRPILPVSLVSRRWHAHVRCSSRQTLGQVLDHLSLPPRREWVASCADRKIGYRFVALDRVQRPLALELS